MASAEQLKMTHSVDGKVMGVDDRVRGIEGQVQGARGDVQEVRGDVRDVGNLVQDVDDKLDKANRSLSFQTLILIPWAKTASQGTSSEIIYYDGFLPQVHPPTTTLHSKPVTTAQLNGFSKEVYSISGNLLVPSCGYMENVCYY